MPLTFVPTDPYDPIVTLLIDEMSAEMRKTHGGSGRGDFMPADVAVPRAVYLVAYEDDYPVGGGALRPFDDSSVELKRMYVRPEKRGQGISRQLLSALEQKARDFGYQRMVLVTGRPQTEAIRLYETAGYTQIPCWGKYASDPINLCYEKALVVQD